MGRTVNATPLPLYPRERPGTHGIEDWVGIRAGLDRCGNSCPPTGIRSPDRPARSESLFQDDAFSLLSPVIRQRVYFRWLTNLNNYVIFIGST